MQHRLWFPLLLLLMLAGGVPAQPTEDPFRPTVTLSGMRLSIAFPVPLRHYLYADSIAVRAPEWAALTAVDIPAGRTEKDAFSEHERAIYFEPVVLVYALKPDPARPAPVEIEWQGCDESLCYPPGTLQVLVSPGGVREGAAESTAPPPPGLPHPAAAADWRTAAKGFTVAGTQAGYLRPEPFVAFLDAALSGAPPARTGLAGLLGRSGPLLSVLIILLGGALLNLTPCVLPLIPINLSIIGAGSAAGSRGRGFALGTVYGLGIAATYGVLGLAVVLGGAPFGALNSTAWFNFAIAGVFVVLALAMFDLVHIDFTRFRPVGAGRPQRGGFWAVGVLGVVSALLAGACVAPVLIAVLLLAGSLHAQGQAAGLALPFLLGLGMALPWPFAGAGLSFLPRPGRWMNRVKQGFGVLILLLAAYYAHLGYGLLGPTAAQSRELAALQERAAQEGGWHTSLAEALAQSRAEGKPLFIDFWATWCKNCLVMDKLTFPDPAVVRRLDAFVKAKVQAERFGDPETKALLAHFEVRGLPTYVVLRPPAQP